MIVPSAISAPSGLMPPEIQTNTGWGGAQITATAITSLRRPGKISLRSANSASRVIPASSCKRHVRRP